MGFCWIQPKLKNTSSFPPLLDAMVSHSLISTTSMFSHQVAGEENTAAIHIVGPIVSLIQSVSTQDIDLAR